MAARATPGGHQDAIHNVVVVGPDALGRPGIDEGLKHELNTLADPMDVGPDPLRITTDP